MLGPQWRNKMGKNQGHKEMQRTRHPTGEDGAVEQPSEDGVDVSFHTPAWHAARLAALTVERVPYEDWKKKQKEEEAARQEIWSLAAASAHF